MLSRQPAKLRFRGRAGNTAITLCPTNAADIVNADGAAAISATDTAKVVYTAGAATGGNKKRKDDTDTKTFGDFGDTKITDTVLLVGGRKDPPIQNEARGIATFCTPLEASDAKLFTCFGNGAQPPRPPRPIRIFFANITEWGPKAEQFLLKSEDELQCIAEHHLDQPQLNTKKPRIYAGGFDLIAGAAVSSGRSITGTSAGVAILARKSLCIQPLDVHLLQRIVGVDLTAHRWQAGFLRLKGMTILVITSYLVHSIGLTDDNLVILEQLTVLIKSIGLPVIVCADWQMHPDMLFESDWPRRAGLVLAEPPGQVSTCNIHTDKAAYLDYFLVSADILPLVVVESVLSVPWKTHIALRLSLHARPHQFLAPVLRLPKQLPSLPLLDGEHILIPELWEEAAIMSTEHIHAYAAKTGVIGLMPHLFDKLPSEQQSVSRAFAAASTRAECYTCLVAKVPRDQIRSYLGRGHMPSIRLKSPFQRRFGNSQFTCAKCDAWTRAVTLLTWLSGASKLSTCHLGRCILDLRAMLPNIQRSWASVRKHNCPISAWTSWISKLTVDALLNPQLGYNAERVKVWIDRALAQKQHAINARVAKVRKNFKSWIYTALQKGAAAAHKYISPQASYSTPPFNLNGIFNQWGQLWRNGRRIDVLDDPKLLVRSWTPWNVQKEQCVDAAVNAARDDDLYFAKHTDIATGGDSILDFGLDEVVAAVNAYPTGKKPGIDAWHPHQLKQLPSEAVRPFATVLCAVQRNATWPIQMLMNLGSLIPKQSGEGQRPISKTPFLYRVWCILRRDKLRDWGSANCPHWDTATPGRSAETEACARLWLMEAASLAGKEAAALLWDLEKFFDTISPDEVRRVAADRCYPPTELKLALSMHRAPRVLQMLGISAAAIIPSRSILQGCFHSNYFARLVIWSPMKRCEKDLDDLREVDKSVARVNANTFVDDVAQLCLGTRKQVTYALAIAGISFVSSVRQYRLIVSTKSLVVASDIRIARVIANAIRDQTCVKLTPSTAGRDLGVHLVATAKRSTKLQKQRVNKTMAKLKRIAPLARKVKGARKLISTGALPQALWASASIGLAPSRIAMLRTATAAACGVGGRGRCASTAIALGIGPEKDPAIVALTRQASVFIDVWRSSPQIRALTTRYWKEATDKVCYNGSVHWNSVRSTLSATIATFTEQGWKLQSPISWIDPKNQEWVADFTAPKAPFLKIIAGHAMQKIWAEAANFYDGTGLQHGVHWQSTLSLHKRLSKSQCLPEEEQQLMELEEQADTLPSTALSWLELFLSGGFWPNARATQANICANSACPRCGFAREDSLHFFWTCPKNRTVLDPRVKLTQTLVTQAVDGSKEAPCLWLRGMLPLNMLHINTPFSETSQLQLVLQYVQPYEWPGGEYFTDGSGGPNNSFPAIRRCGFGIVLLKPGLATVDFCNASEPSDLITFGAFGVLPGNLHTVPRAELYAIVEIIVNLRPFSIATITSDSKVNVDLYLQGESVANGSTNGDLWADIFSTIRTKSLEVTLRWSKGHATMEIVQQYNITAKDALGNLVADSLADRAAQLHQVYQEDAFAIKWHLDLVTRIQKRAIVLLNLFGLREQQKIPKQPAEHTATMSIAAHAMASQHSFTSFGKTLFCYKCHQTSPKGIASIRQWLATSCRPDTMLQATYTAGTVRPTRIPPERAIRVGNATIHPTHIIFIFRGLYFCRNCSCFAIKKLENLARPCDPAGKGPGDAKRKRLAAIALLQGKLPRGVHQWPNSSDHLLLLDG